MILHADEIGKVVSYLCALAVCISLCVGIAVRVVWVVTYILLMLVQFLVIPMSFVCYSMIVRNSFERNTTFWIPWSLYLSGVFLINVLFAVLWQDFRKYLVHSNDSGGIAHIKHLIQRVFLPILWFYALQILVPYALGCKPVFDLFGWHKRMDYEVAQILWIRTCIRMVVFARLITVLWKLLLPIGQYFFEKFLYDTFENEMVPQNYHED